jgi:hypothetical protein
VSNVLYAIQIINHLGEIPAYIPLKVTHKYSYKYSLYLHRENSYNTQLLGIPLLFIHGNAGKYKQVLLFHLILGSQSRWIVIMGLDEK